MYERSPLSQISDSHTLTRREFLPALGSAAAGLALADMTIAQPTPPAVDPNGHIDAHVHVWTPDVKKYPLAPGFKPADMVPPSFTPQELATHSKPCGVTRTVLIQMSFYKYDNSYMLDCIKQFPGTFSGVAIVDHSQADVVAKMRDLAKQGVRGFRLAPGTASPETYFGDAGIEAMWRCGAEDNLKMCLLINPNALATVDKLCEKFKDTPVVVDHFARIGINGPPVEAELVQLCRLARHKNTYVKVSAFYALGKKQSPYVDLLNMVRILLDTFGPERLMWASDCPFQVQQGHTYRDSIDLILKRADFLKDADRKHLLTKTAEKVFFA